MRQQSIKDLIGRMYGFVPKRKSFIGEFNINT